MSTISIWKILITHQPLFFLISYLLVRKIEVFLEYFLGQKLSKTAIVGSAAADYSRLFLCEETCWVNLIIVGQPYSSPVMRAQYSLALAGGLRRASGLPCQLGRRAALRRRTVFTARCCSAGRTNTTHSSCYPNRSKSLKFYSEITSLTKKLWNKLTFDMYCN